MPKNRCVNPKIAVVNTTDRIGQFVAYNLKYLNKYVAENEVFSSMNRLNMLNISVNNQIGVIKYAIIMSAI